MAESYIYLDHASTTPTDPRVLKAMLPYFSDIFFNPSSLYQGGLKAKAAIDSSRQTVAKFLNCKPSEVIFTSGGTESDNMAILGIAGNFKKGHIITSQIEHPAVLKVCKRLEDEGFEITYLKPSAAGFILIDDLKKALRPDTILVSIMYANNEIGTVQPIAEISDVVRNFRNSKSKIKNLKWAKAYPLLHTDACQATQYLEMDVEKLGVDLLTINGSKIYGPKGVGALYARETVSLKPIIIGGGQERSLRSGTENTPGIVGLAKAIELIDKNQGQKETKLRDFMIENLLKIKDSALNGSLKNRLPNNINITFDGVEGEAALLHLDRRGIACSTGSACSSKSLEPSQVLLSIGKKPEQAHCSLRFTIGKKNNKIEIQKAIREIEIVINNLRQISAIYEKKE